MAAHISLQSGCSNSVENNRIDNSHSLPPSAFSVAYEKQESLNPTACRNERKDAETFPKIVEVFSLNPSMPVGHFQDHVTVIIAPNGTIAESVVGESLENNVRKQNETFCNRNFQERSFPDNNNKFMQASSQGFARQTSLYDANFQMNQCSAVTDDYIDIEIGENVVNTVSLSEANSFFNEMYNGYRSEVNSAKKEDIRNAHAIVSTNKVNVLEQVHFDVTAKIKRKRRRRKTIFGLRRSKKRCLIGDFNFLKEKDQHERDAINNKSVQFECYGSPGYANMNTNNISIPEESKKNQPKQSQGKIGDNGNSSKHGDEEHTTTPVSGQTELKCTGLGTIESDHDHSFCSGKISLLHGNDTRQNKILDLKAKLAKQEQELQSLNQRKDLEDSEREDCGSHVGPNEAGLEMNVSAFLEDETMFDFSHQTGFMKLWAQNMENDEDINFGKIEDLKDIFQKVIKSFTILDTKLYPTERIVDYGHHQKRNDKSIFAYVDNRIEDVASKDEFLLQLGLMRI